MFLRIISFIFGIILIVTGLVSSILYLNLLINGYTFFDYVNFIIRRFECICFFLGLLVLYLSIFIGGKK